MGLPLPAAYAATQVAAAEERDGGDIAPNAHSEIQYL